MNRKGFSLLEVGLAIGVTALTVAGMLHVQTDSSDSIKANAAADQLVQIQQAAQIYVNENFNTLYVPETSGTTNTLQVSDLVNAGLLPQGFNPSNVYGQTIQVQLTRGTQQINGVSVPVENGLVVTTNGVTIDDKNLGRIMARIGAGGGAYLSNPPPGVTPGTILGYGNGWSVSAADYPSVKEGHAVATLNFGANSTQFGDQLYRNYLGPTELNTMHTLIDANGNNIDNLNALRFTPSTTAAASNCQEPTSGQTEENLMGASANPCLVYDGSTDWMTYNSNGVSNGLLVGQSAGNNAAITGQSLGVTTNGIQFYNGAAGSATSPNGNYIGGLSMNPANGNTIYTTANGLTQGGVALNTAGGDFSTGATPSLGSDMASWGSVTAGNITANHGSVFVTNDIPASTDTQQFLSSPVIANLAVTIGHNGTDQGGYMNMYDAGGHPIVQTGDDGNGNGQILLENNAGTTVGAITTTASGNGNLSINNNLGNPSIQASVNGDGGGAVNVYNDLASSIASLQETVNHGGTVELQNSNANTVASLGDDGSGRGLLALNNQLAVHLATGGENGNGGGYFETYNQNTGPANLISNDASGNGQITVNDTTATAAAQLGVTNGAGGYLDIYNATHHNVGELEATANGNGSLLLNDASDSLKLRLDAGENGYGTGRIQFYDADGNTVLSLQGDANHNGSIIINDASGNGRVAIGVNASQDSGQMSISDISGNTRVGVIVDSSNNGQLTISNTNNAAQVTAGVAATSWTAIPGQIIAALTGQVTATGAVGVGPADNTGSLNAYLYESGGVGYGYVEGGIDSHCFDDQGGNLLLQNGCNLLTAGNSISTQNGSNYGTLTAGNTTLNGTLLVNGHVADDCFNDTTGAFDLNCAASLGSTLTVGGATTLNGGLTVNGATTLNGGVTVTNGVLNTTNSGIDSKCFNDTSGTFYVSCNLSMTGTATVGTLEVTSGGIKIDQGNLAINNGGLTDKCMSDINDTLAISCSSTFNNGLSVTNGVLNTTAGGIDSKCFNDTAGTFNFTCNDVSLPGNLTVNNVHVTNNETIDGNLTVAGGIASKCFNDETGEFSVTCAAKFSGGLEMTNGDLVIDSGHIRDNCFDDRDGTFRLSCNLAINGTLSVTGKATVGSLEVTNGNLTVDNGYITDKCLSDVNDTFAVSCASRLGGGLTVSGGVSDFTDSGIDSKCFNDFTGGFAVTCGTYFGNGFTVSGGTNFQGGIDVSGGNLSVDNGTIRDNCFNDANATFAVNGCSMTISNGSSSGGTNNGRLSVMGYSAPTYGDNVNYPVGWGGGIVTYDLYAHGSVGVGGGGNPAADMSMDSNGNGEFFINSPSHNLVTLGANSSTNYGGYMTINNVSGTAVATLSSDGSNNGYFWMQNANGGRIAEIGVGDSGNASFKMTDSNGHEMLYLGENGDSNPQLNVFRYEAQTTYGGSGRVAYIDSSDAAASAPDSHTIPAYRGGLQVTGIMGVAPPDGDANAYLYEDSGNGGYGYISNDFRVDGQLKSNGSFQSPCMQDTGALSVGCSATDFWNSGATVKVGRGSGTLGVADSNGNINAFFNESGGQGNLWVNGNGNVFGNFTVGQTNEFSTAAVYGQLFVNDTSNPSTNNTYINGEEMTTQKVNGSKSVSTQGSLFATGNGSFVWGQQFVFSAQNGSGGNSVPSTYAVLDGTGAIEATGPASALYFEVNSAPYAPGTPCNGAFYNGSTTNNTLLAPGTTSLGNDMMIGYGSGSVTDSEGNSISGNIPVVCMPDGKWHAVVVQ